jgi:transglutaminase-like putative cysteine protease
LTGGAPAPIVTCRTFQAPIRPSRRTVPRPARAAAAALLLPAALAAQAPRITPAGDPSVKADTIYRLAVDPKAHPEDDAYFLLDDGVVRVEADGRHVSTFRQIVQVLKPEGAERMREQSLSWAPRHQRFTVNWVRVVRPDGTVISARPSQVQDSDVAAEMGDPVYSERRVRRMSLTGVAPGTIIDYSYTTEELKPFLAGDFYQPWGVSTGLGVRRSRFIVDAPASMTLGIREENLTFARRTQRVGTGPTARTVHTWATGDLTRIKPELFAADSNGVYQSVTVAAPLAWGDIGRWYAANARGRYTLGPAAAARLDEVLRPARTRDDSLRLVHRWAAQDIRYVSIALGMGGYRPRTPDEVVRTGFGDCKDKATLFVAALARMGVTAYPVILNASGRVRRELPSISQLDHAIAAVVLPGGGYQFVDLTAKFTPYGELPGGYHGEFGMVVRPDGATEVVTFPTTPVGADRDETRITGTLAEDGTFSGRFEETTAGVVQAALRSAFEHPLDTAQVRRVSTAIAGRYFEGAEGDSLEVTPGLDLAAAPRVAVRIRGGRAATASGGTMILKLPFGTLAAMARTAKELESEAERRFPIDAARVAGPVEVLTELRVRLPAGWRAELPQSVRAESPFGTYESTYAQEGDELRVTRRMRGARGVHPPSARPQLAEWLRAAAKDDATLVVLSRPAAGATGAAATGR